MHVVKVFLKKYLYFVVVVSPLLLLYSSLELRNKPIFFFLKNYIKLLPGESKTKKDLKQYYFWAFLILFIFTINLFLSTFSFFRPIDKIDGLTG